MTCFLHESRYIHGSVFLLQLTLASGWSVLGMIGLVSANMVQRRDFCRKVQRFSDIDAQLSRSTWTKHALCLASLSSLDLRLLESLNTLHNGGR